VLHFHWLCCVVLTFLYRWGGVSLRRGALVACIAHTSSVVDGTCRLVPWVALEPSEEVEFAFAYWVESDGEEVFVGYVAGS
jgi:hypothetical protein